jgi:hypothetical protein
MTDNKRHSDMCVKRLEECEDCFRKFVYSETERRNNKNTKRLVVDYIKKEDLKHENS